MPDTLDPAPSPGPIVGEPPPLPRQWTFMVYLAGDNNLEGYGREDLEEMKQIGSTDQVAIVAQYDRMKDGGTRRYLLRQGTPLESDEIGDDLGETNTGDPAELVRFLSWAASEYPAERYAMVLWNHGTGWKEDDLYHGLSEVRPSRAGAAVPTKSLWRALRKARRPPLWVSSLGAILSRGIGYDDSSSDFLDNAELQHAIRCGMLGGGIDKLSIVGFDACLMSMVEVAYQIKDSCDYLVASQETEPGDGWPYAKILAPLVADPTMGPEALSTIIVEAYMASYAASDQVTQSALDLSRVDEVVSAIDALCTFVLEYYDECELIIGRASRRAQLYSDKDYKDLYDLCRALVDHGSAVPPLQDRARAIMDLLVPSGPDRFVVAEGHKGGAMTRSHGVSIYLPYHAMSPFYKRLDFSSESLWDDMLHRLFGV